MENTITIPTMRAKMEVRSLEKYGEPVTSIQVKMNPVCGKTPFGPNGESEDNSFARWTPTGSLELSINNPNLFNKLSVGQKFYLDFTEVQAEG